MASSDGVRRLGSWTARVFGSWTARVFGEPAARSPGLRSVQPSDTPPRSTQPLRIDKLSQPGVASTGRWLSESKVLEWWWSSDMMCETRQKTMGDGAETRDEDGGL